MAINSLTKGKRGELSARDAVREHWSAPGCARAAQCAGAYSADLLHAGHTVHVEVKKVARLATKRYIQQAERDAGEDEFPVVVMRLARGKWCVIFWLQDSVIFPT